jgi:hypothetical protein
MLLNRAGLFLELFPWIGVLDSITELDISLFDDLV